jgi:hypothetical protein
MRTEIKNIKRSLRRINLLVKIGHQIQEKIIANSTKYILRIKIH